MSLIRCINISLRKARKSVFHFKICKKIQNFWEIQDTSHHLTFFKAAVDTTRTRCALQLQKTSRTVTMQPLSVLLYSFRKNTNYFTHHTRFLPCKMLLKYTSHFILFINTFILFFYLVMQHNATFLVVFLLIFPKKKKT